MRPAAWAEAERAVAGCISIYADPGGTRRLQTHEDVVARAREPGAHLTPEGALVVWTCFRPYRHPGPCRLRPCAAATTPEQRERYREVLA